MRKKVQEEEANTPIGPLQAAPPEIQDLFCRALAVALNHHMTVAGVKSFVTFIQKGHKPEEYLGKGKKGKKPKGKALAGLVKGAKALADSPLGSFLAASWLRRTSRSHRARQGVVGKALGRWVPGLVRAVGMAAKTGNATAVSGQAGSGQPAFKPYKPFTRSHFQTFSRF